MHNKPAKPCWHPIPYLSTDKWPSASPTMYGNPEETRNQSIAIQQQSRGHIKRIYHGQCIIPDLHLSIYVYTFYTLMYTSIHIYKYVNIPITRLKLDRRIGVRVGGPHLISLGLTWSHLDSLDLSWTQWISLELSWTYLVSLGFT